jgi:hypothetical protein
MANIQAQPTPQRIWPWVLGIAVVLLIVLARRVRDTSSHALASGEVAPHVERGVERSRAAAERFLRFVRDEPPNFGDMNAAHEYTRNGLGYLASALDEIIVVDGRSAPNIQTSVQALREGVGALRADAPAPRHAMAAKAAIDQAVQTMSELQRTHFPEARDEIDELSRAAERVAPGRPLLDQREAVQEFFDEAVTAIEAMGGPAPPGQ